MVSEDCVRQAEIAVDLPPVHFAAAPEDYQICDKRAVLGRRRYRRRKRLHHRFNRRKILSQQLVFFAIFGGAAFLSTRILGITRGPDGGVVWAEEDGHQQNAQEKPSYGRLLFEESNATLRNASTEDCIDQEIAKGTKLIVRPQSKACNMNNWTEVCNYPDDGFTAGERSDGAIMLHIIGVAFMFLGLAIICDEYFETALEAICDALDLKEDVAGATFMAAGGSAPELFTSIMGTFFAKSDIGFGTIVGSAVFNVLFVIAMCAFVTNNLQLTWWPLTRDSTYYCTSILVLVIWFEAVILLLMYGGYVTVMYFNEELEAYVTKQLLKNNKKGSMGSIGELLKQYIYHPSGHFDNFMMIIILANCIVIAIELFNWLNFPNDAECGNDVCLQYALCVTDGVQDKKYGIEGFPKVPDDSQWSDILNDCVINVGNGMPTDNGGTGKIEFESAGCETRSMFSTLNIVFSVLYILEMLSKWLALGFWGYWRDPLNLGDGILVLLILVEVGLSGGSAAGALRGLKVVRVFRTLRLLRIVRLYRMLYVEKVDASTQTDEEDTRRPSVMAQQSGFKVKMAKSSVMPAESIESSVKADEPSPAEPANGGPSDPCDNGDGDGSGGDDDDDDDDGPFDPFDIPDDILGKIYWAFAFPLAFLMFVTVPDCRKDGWEKVFPLTFTMCIVWITGLSYVMVWMTTVIGDFAGIPDAVMGLTLLASGTSIPDLLSSVAVAKRGFGDMAVSSSIGSNVFDILIGLPIPWLLFGILNSGDPVVIGSEGLTVMVLTLFIMVAAVIALIHMNKWLMTKKLGVYMVILYFLFVALSLLLEYKVV